MFHYFFLLIGLIKVVAGEGAPPPSAFSLADFITALPTKQVPGVYIFWHLMNVLRGVFFLAFR